MDYACAVQAKADGPDVIDIKKSNNVSFTKIEQEDLNDRVEEPLSAVAKG